MVVSEVLAREGAVWALGFVEDWDVRLDPTVMNKPVRSNCAANLIQQLVRLPVPARSPQTTEALRIHSDFLTALATTSG